MGVLTGTCRNTTPKYESQTCRDCQTRTGCEEVGPRSDDLAAPAIDPGPPPTPSPQAVHFGFRLGDVPVPVRYFAEASSINFRRSVRYGLATVGTVARWWLHRAGLWRSPLFAD